MTDSAATKHPPSDDDLRRTMIVVAVVAVFYVVVYGPVTLPAINLGVPRVPDAVLDFAIRNQGWLFALLGVTVAAAAGHRARQSGAVDAAFRDVAPEFAGAGITASILSANAPAAAVALGKVALSPRLRPFTLLIVPFVVLALLAGTAGVVSADAELELPAMTREATGAAAGERDLLLFVHGWNGDDQGTWRQFPNLVLTDSRFDGYDVWSIAYPTFMFRRQLSVAGMADFFVAQLMDVHRVFDRYRRIVVVAHSMGGLIAREVTLQAALRGRLVSFHQLIEIAVPHDGADPAGFVSALRISEDLTRDMRASSDFLRDLRTHWNALASKPPTYCIGSPQDRVVSDTSAIAQCSEHTRYPQGGHTDIVKPESVRDYRYATPMSRVLPPAMRTP